jgi:hypothetical protein
MSLVSACDGFNGHGRFPRVENVRSFSASNMPLRLGRLIYDFTAVGDSGRAIIATRRKDLPIEQKAGRRAAGPRMVWTYCGTIGSTPGRIGRTWVAGWWAAQLLKLCAIGRRKRRIGQRRLARAWRLMTEVKGLIGSQVRVEYARTWYQINVYCRSRGFGLRALLLVGRL